MTDIAMWLRLLFLLLAAWTIAILMLRGER